MSLITFASGVSDSEVTSDAAPGEEKKTGNVFGLAITTENFGQNMDLLQLWDAQQIRSIILIISDHCRYCWQI